MKAIWRCDACLHSSPDPLIDGGCKTSFDNRFGAPIKALKNVFQVCEFSREADEIVHQMWWYTDDAVCTSPIARGRQMTSPKHDTMPS